MLKMFLTLTIFVFLSNQITKAKKEAQMKACDENRLIEYLAKIQVINPESILTLATVDEPQTVCEMLSESIDRFNEYFKSCKLDKKKNVYVQLTKGIDALNEKLCNDRKFHEEFVYHVECYRDLGEEYKDCEGPADWYEDQEQDRLCRTFRNIADCYYTKTVAICSKDAAHLFREMATGVIGRVLEKSCSNLDKDPKIDPALLESDSEGKSQGEDTILSLDIGQRILKENKIILILSFTFFII